MKKIFQFKWVMSLLLAGVVTCALAQTMGLTGRWQGEVHLADGSVYPVTYNLQSDKGILTGNLQAEGDPKQVVDGKVEGNNFSFRINDEDGSQIQHSGSYIAQGDSVSLNLVYHGSKLHATLKRMPASN